MSLTSFLKDNLDVREKFRREFKIPEFAVSKTLLVPCLSKRHSLIGTAFDYLLRFQVQRLNPQSIETTWIAEEPVKFWEEGKECLSKYDKELWKKEEAIVLNAKSKVSAYLKSGQISDGLIASALQLATLDAFERSGRGEELIGIVQDEDIKELRSLSLLVKGSDFKTDQLCLLNPRFGPPGVLVGGADADLFIDETLIEIKTTKHLKLEPASFNQLVGYFILHQLGGIGELQPKVKVSKLAIYFARFGYMHTMDVSDIINLKTLPIFLRWFETKAKEQFSEEW